MYQMNINTLLASYSWDVIAAFEVRSLLLDLGLVRVCVLKVKLEICFPMGGVWKEKLHESKKPCGVFVQGSVLQMSNQVSLK